MNVYYVRVGIYQIIYKIQNLFKKYLHTICNEYHSTNAVKRLKYFKRGTSYFIRYKL